MFWIYSKRSFTRYLFIISFTFSTWVLFQLYYKYGDLFYKETYLPLPELPQQFLKSEVFANFNKTDISPKILCFIVTTPPYHAKRAVHVAATWARHCDRAIFVTSKYDDRLSEVLLVENFDRYTDLWHKVKKAFSWASNSGLTKKYDWFLKCDDDTFVFIENLKSSLRSFNSKEKIAIGRRLYTWDTNEIYLNGGAGYVLSSSAVDQLVERGLAGKTCDKTLNLGTNEDVNMARCLTYLGVKLIDSQEASDADGQFHIYPPHEQLDPRQSYSWGHLWLKKIAVRPYYFGFRNISKRPISFHYVSGEAMYLIYYLAYIAVS